MTEDTSAKLLIEIAEQHGDFVVGDDGFAIWWPTSTGSRGALTSWMLRALADEIDRRNEGVEAALAEYFSKCRCDGVCECTPSPTKG